MENENQAGAVTAFICKDCGEYEFPRYVKNGLCRVCQIELVQRIKEELKAGLVATTVFPKHEALLRVASILNMNTEEILKERKGG